MNDLPPEWEQDEPQPPQLDAVDDLVNWVIAIFAILAGAAILAWVAVAAARLFLEVIG